MTELIKDAFGAVQEKFSYRTFFYFCFSWIAFNLEDVAYWLFSEDPYNRKLAWLAGKNFSCFDYLIWPLLISIFFSVLFPFIASFLNFFTKTVDSYFVARQRVLEDRFNDRFFQNKISKTDELTKAEENLRLSILDSKNLLNENLNLLEKAKNLQKDRLELFASERGILDDFKKYNFGLSRVKAIIANVINIEELCRHFQSIEKIQYNIDEVDNEDVYIHLFLNESSTGKHLENCFIDVSSRLLFFGQDSSTFSSKKIQFDLTGLVRDKFKVKDYDPQGELANIILEHWRAKKYDHNPLEKLPEVSVKIQRIYTYVYRSRDVTKVMEDVALSSKSAKMAGRIEIDT